MDLLDLAERLSGLSTAALAILILLMGGVGWWGFTWQHKQQLVLKDALVEEVRSSLGNMTKDRDEWKAHALQSAETTSQYADHVEHLTEVMEALVPKAKT